MADYVFNGQVGANSKLTYPIRVFICVSVEVKLVEQFLIVALQRTYPGVDNLDNQWRFLKHAVLNAEVVTYHAVGYKGAIDPGG